MAVPMMNIVWLTDIPAAGSYKAYTFPVNAISVAMYATEGYIKYATDLVAAAFPATGYWTVLEGEKETVDGAVFAGQTIYLQAETANDDLILRIILAPNA